MTNRISFGHYYSLCIWNRFAVFLRCSIELTSQTFLLYVIVLSSLTELAILFLFFTKERRHKQLTKHYTTECNIETSHEFLGRDCCEIEHQIPLMIDDGNVNFMILNKTH